MAKAQVERQLDIVIETAFSAVEPFGFKKQGNRSRRLADGNAAIVEFQRSVGSNADEILFTLNVGVVSGRLLEGKSPAKAGTIDAQLRMRLGDFLSEPHDKWWIVGESTPVGLVAAEVTKLLLEAAVPFLLAHATDDSLAVLWKTRQSPGLTSRQRDRYLAQLSAQAAS